CFIFFFQAEDGIRDLIVTGVQTCALPIFLRRPQRHGALDLRGAVVEAEHRDVAAGEELLHREDLLAVAKTALREEADLAEGVERSEERRVGKEGRGRGWRVA